MRLQSQLLSEKRFDKHLDLFLSVAANNSLRRLDASGIHTRHFAANLLYLRPFNLNYTLGRGTKKRASGLRSQKSLIQLADFLDLVFQVVVVLDRPLHSLLLLRAKADVPDLAAWLTHCQNQDGMAFATITLGATGLVTNCAL
jgi:hypothetical protein